jgi:hypothetical protein
MLGADTQSVLKEIGAPAPAPQPAGGGKKDAP